VNHERDDGPRDRPGMTWRKSSRSNGTGGNCVELALLDRHSDKSDSSAPEVTRKADQGPLVVIRDSKDPDGPRLYFTRSEWTAFRLSVLDGEFDDLG
jgi:hypothetical protein